MKGTLLVLALLVTTELGFQTAEACAIFYDTFGKVAIGKREPLFDTLDVANATEPEKAAFAKIQDCFNEGGLEAKILDTKILLAIASSKECLLENPASAFQDSLKIPKYIIAKLSKEKS